MADTLVRFEGVRKTYGGGAAAAVVGLDLEIARGELMTLLGPSGSGKTTTLMMLAGFEMPSAGRICSKPRHRAYRPAQAWHRRGVPVLRAISAYECGENVSPLCGVGQAERGRAC